MNLENTYIILRIIGAALGAFLAWWKIVLPLIDTFLRYRVDKVFKLEELRKKVDNHDTAINYLADAVQNLEKICQEVPSTTRILAEMKNIVDKLAQDFGTMNVLVGRIDERTQRIMQKT